MLAGRYRVIGLLGQGGMGEVYRADDVKLGQPVALKFLPEKLTHDADRLARFHNEVRVARQVSHPNVCRVYDIAESDGAHFLSMEFVDGEDLASLLRRIGRLPRDKALQIARQLCAGVAAAHERGILHRDLKPANVMIDGRGTVRITDFGLAALAAELVRENPRAGTPAYMAPEQLEGKPASVRSDVYSLGLVLYKMFTGKAAFDSEVLSELIRQQCDDTPTTPSSVVDDIDPAVDRVILRCLEKDPRHRPASALAVAAALPGGDPLAAALAAGETPAPELVAAAGDLGGMRPAVAGACLAAALLGVLVLVLLNSRVRTLSLWPLPYAPEVLAAKASDIIRGLGYDVEPADTAFDFDRDNSCLDWVAEHDASPNRWANLRNGSPSPIRFWFRQSPHSLVPTDWTFGPSIVTWDDPQINLSGMVNVELDANGRLIKLIAVPPQRDRESGTTQMTDDAGLFAHSDLDPTKLTTTQPEWTPPVWSDSRAAWAVPSPAPSKIPVRIETATYRGRPVYYDTIFPWTKPWRSEPFQMTTTQKLVTGLQLLVVLSILVGGVLLARRNLRQGRGDRRGASRLAAFTFAVGVLGWALGSKHVPEIQEFLLFLAGLSSSLLFAAFVWVLYVALEPFVRRRWPHSLIAWSRLLSGRLRDPLVGHDVLMGGCFALAGVVIARLGHWLPPLLGVAAPVPEWENLSQLRSGRLFAAELPGDALVALCSAFGLLFLMFFLRAVLRRTWLAAAVVVLIFAVPPATWSSAPVVQGVISATRIGLYVFVLVRFGLLALVAMYFMDGLLYAMPISLNLTAWYGGYAACSILIAVAILLYGFLTALAGQPLWRSDLLET